MTLTMAKISPVDSDVVVEDGTVILRHTALGINYDDWLALPRPRGWYIAVMQRPQPKKTKGGIILTQDTLADRASLDYVGRVFAMGEACYRHEDFMIVEPEADMEAPGGVKYSRVQPAPRCAIGDWVIFMRHEQLRVPVYPSGADKSDDVLEVRFTTDRAVLAVVPNPDRLKVYIA